MRILLILILLSSSFSLKAGKFSGYYVTNNLDTISCYIILADLSVVVLNGHNLKNYSGEKLSHKPTNLAEAVWQLTKSLPDSTQQKVLSMTESEFIANSHFGLEMWIRNNWIYWGNRQLKKNFDSIGILQPDDKSGIILTCYYRQLHNQD